jgi:hypothetical protein
MNINNLNTGTNSLKRKTPTQQEDSSQEATSRFFSVSSATTENHAKKPRLEEDRIFCFAKEEEAEAEENYSDDLLTQPLNTLARLDYLSEKIHPHNLGEAIEFSPITQSETDNFNLANLTYVTPNYISLSGDIDLAVIEKIFLAVKYVEISTMVSDSTLQAIPQHIIIVITPLTPAEVVIAIQHRRIRLCGPIAPEILQHLSMEVKEIEIGAGAIIKTRKDLPFYVTPVIIPTTSIESIENSFQPCGMSPLPFKLEGDISPDLAAKVCAKTDSITIGAGVPAAIVQDLPKRVEITLTSATPIDAVAALRHEEIGLAEDVTSTIAARISFAVKYISLAKGMAPETIQAIPPHVTLTVPGIEERDKFQKKSFTAIIQHPRILLMNKLDFGLSDRVQGIELGYEELTDKEWALIPDNVLITVGKFTITKNVDNILRHRIKLREEVEDEVIEAIIKNPAIQIVEIGVGVNFEDIEELAKEKVISITPETSNEIIAGIQQNANIQEVEIKGLASKAGEINFLNRSNKVVDMMRTFSEKSILITPETPIEIVAAIQSSKIILWGSITQEIIVRIPSSVHEVEIKSGIAGVAVKVLPTTVKVVQIACESFRSPILIKSTFSLPETEDFLNELTEIIVAIPAKINVVFNDSSEREGLYKELLELREASISNKYLKAIQLLENFVAEYPNLYHAYKLLQNYYNILGLDGKAFMAKWHCWRLKDKMDPKISLLERTIMTILDQHDVIFSLGLVDFMHNQPSAPLDVLGSSETLSKQLQKNQLRPQPNELTRYQDDLNKLIKLNNVLALNGVTHNHIQALSDYKGNLSSATNLISILHEIQYRTLAKIRQLQSFKL